MVKKIALLGSTGSIGTQTLDVVSQFPQSLQIVGLAAGGNIRLLKEQIHKYKPQAVSVRESKDKEQLKNSVKDIYSGDTGNCEIATLPSADIVVVATPGLAGINPTLEAIKQKKTIALATKEVLVSAGSLVTRVAQKNKVKLLPIDSEHSALFQCLADRSIDEVNKIIITASGGPFRGKKLSDLKHITPSQALKHPNWSMGRKISIDSATLMNKGFEVIEAMWLFGIPLEKIQVVVHPQSIIHSAVEFVDGSIIAQLGPSDMRLPIQHALLYPQRRQQNNFKRFSFADYPSLSFEQPDLKTFRCLQLAFDAATIGGSMPAVLTAANDVAVDAFLAGGIPFLKISEISEQTMKKHTVKFDYDLKELFKIDRWARNFASSL